MHLILWRHAEAVEGVPDIERELTRKGHRQAAKMAAWLNQQLPAHVRVITSPAQRAIQTASALTDNFDVIDSIAPGASSAAVLGATAWPGSRRAVVLVGHQPTLGEVAALLVAGRKQPWSIKKGAVWWLTHRVRDSKAQIVLRAVIAPDMLD
ncbi:MAG: histidine phosphatase family protein [Betaproteobacteria bacterium]|nr:MAG: histidine phosphatase family protein [Betaproteobacteria bacterium]